MAKTSKEYMQSIKNRVVSIPILEDCIYSCNKRAKNYRDKANEYRKNQNNYFYYGDNLQRLFDKMNEYYEKKGILLSLLQPTCIHRDVKITNKRVRIYDYEDEYFKVPDKNVIYENGYYDKDMDEYVEFKDVYENQETVNFFLYYKTANRSFHTPINEFDLSKYSNLKILNIENFETFGANVKDLVSVQFCDAVIKIIKSNDYSFIQ